MSAPDPIIPLSSRAWSRNEFEAQLLALGRRYHIFHPFHLRMNQGGCSRLQLQRWVANRFYYQACIPLKDAAIMANCPEHAVRRLWLRRLIDQDGFCGQEGGLEAWLRLAEAVGLHREAVTSFEFVLPGVRFACDAYVNFARRATWQEACCASLTELFAPEIHLQRLDNWPSLYPWIKKEGYDYFRQRLQASPRDALHGLEVTLGHFVTRAQQERALQIVQMKLDILWTMLDAMQLAYFYNEPPYHNC